MKEVKEIKVVAFHKGGKNVRNRDEANFVTLRNGDDFLILPKHGYDLSRDPKPVKRWHELPETV